MSSRTASAALAKALVPYCSDHFAVTGLSERTRTKLIGQLAEKFPRLASSAKSSFAAAHLATAHFGGSIEPPRPIPGARWQAGVSERNSRYKIELDGEPVIGAVAANDVRGWVLAVVDKDGAITRPVRRFGRVRILPGDRN